MFVSQRVVHVSILGDFRLVEYRKLQMHTRKHLIVLISSVLFALLWSGQASAVTYSSGLTYITQQGRLSGYSETYLTGEYAEDMCVGWQLTAWWGDLEYYLDPPLCSVVEVHDYSAGLTGYLYGPSGLYGSLYSNYTSHAFVSYSVDSPEGGSWTAAADHFLHEDVWQCYFSYYWYNEAMYQQFEGCDYIYTFNWFLDTTFAHASAPGGCAGERATMIAEYTSYGSSWIPTCAYFSSGGTSAHFTSAELNDNFSADNTHVPWTILRPALWAGLENTRSIYSRGGIRVSSGYRCPHGNALAGGVINSQHPRGTAADLYSNDHPWTEAEWTLLRDAAVSAGAGYVTTWTTYADRHLHADWRNSP